MTKRIRSAIDWAFAFTFAVAGFCLLVWVALHLMGESEVDVSVGGYSYKGPIYLWLPWLFTTIASLAGCAAYLGMAFYEGREKAKWEILQKEIQESLPDPGPDEQAPPGILDDDRHE